MRSFILTVIAMLLPMQAWGGDVVIGRVPETGKDFIIINCTIKDKAGHKE